MAGLAALEHCVHVHGTQIGEHRGHPPGAATCRTVPYDDAPEPVPREDRAAEGEEHHPGQADRQRQPQVRLLVALEAQVAAPVVAPGR